MLQFVSPFHAGGYFTTVYNHRREILVLGTFFSEIKTRILDRSLLIIGFIRTVGEILASSRKWSVLSLTSAVPGIDPVCLVWFQRTSFSAQLKLSVVPLILMADTSKGSTEEFKNVTYCFQALCSLLLPFPLKVNSLLQHRR